MNKHERTIEIGIDLVSSSDSDAQKITPGLPKHELRVGFFSIILKFLISRLYFSDIKASFHETKEVIMEYNLCPCIPLPKG